MQREIIALVIGIAAGVILTLILSSVIGGGNRYSLLASSDGSVVHKIDTATGRVWWKNSYVETDADGQPVTIWYWEELTLDRPGARQVAKDVESSAAEVRQQELERMKARTEELEALKQKRLNEIYIICGEDLDCVETKCADGFQGSDDPEWTAYCAGRLKTHIMDVVIEQCRADSRCIKTYCRNKYNNTYPHVSDCIDEINLRKAGMETGDSGAGAQ